MQDFPWLAAALAPGAALLALLGLGSAVAGGALVPVDDGPVWTTLANLLVVVADALSYAALATLAAAALCYSRNWFKALVDLIWIVLLLKFVLWFVEYVLLEIGIVERVLAILVESILGFDLPDWLGELSDRISYGLLLLGINLAVIGATWTTSRQSFGQLLATGSVDIVKAVREVVDPPDAKAVAKREQKAARKAEKRQQKTERAEQKAAQKAARKGVTSAARFLTGYWPRSTRTGGTRAAPCAATVPLKPTSNNPPSVPATHRTG